MLLTFSKVASPRSDVIQCSLIDNSPAAGINCLELIKHSASRGCGITVTLLNIVHSNLDCLARHGV